MRKNVYQIVLLFAVLLTACKKKDAVAPLQPVAISVSLQLAQEQQQIAIPYKGAKITISNVVTGQKYSDTLATEVSTVNFSSVVPGSYDVSVTLNVSAAEYEALTGIKSEGVVFYSGSLSAQSATAVQNSFTVELRTGGDANDWVIKQIYYAGSDTKNGAIFRDQFIELYNNSDHELYADSLYISQLEGYSSPLATQDFSKGLYQASGQWDWTKSAGMTDLDANTAFMYGSSVFRIPGTGKTYPVAAGKSIIIATTAINHKTPYVDINGKTVSVLNSDLTVDLSAADFDVYMGNQAGISPLASDLNTSTTHLDVVLNYNRDLILDAPGREGIMIFRTNADPKTAWKTFKTPDNLTSGKLKLQMPKAAMNILDVVEIQPTDNAKRTAKRVSLDLDAGYNFVTDGSYSSQSLLRKTSKTVNGRIVLQDTNNSTVDFITIKADATKTAFSN